MRMMIELPESAWRRIREDAGRERRYPRQQVEHVVLTALGHGSPQSGSRDTTIKERRTEEMTSND